MAYEKEQFLDAYPTDGDLSAAQYKAVVLGTDGKLDLAGAAVRVLGILVDDAPANERGTVCHFGFTKAMAGAAVAAGALLMTDGTTGRLITATGTNLVVGRALAAASAAGSIIPVFVCPMGNLALA